MTCPPRGVSGRTCNNDNLMNWKAPGAGPTFMYLYDYAPGGLLKLWGSSTIYGLSSLSWAPFDWRLFEFVFFR